MKPSSTLWVALPFLASLAAAQVAGTIVQSGSTANATVNGTVVTGTTAISGSVVTIAPVPVAPPVSPPPVLVGTVELPQIAGETSLLLDLNFGIRAVLPSRVTVPVGEMLRVTAPNQGPLQWRRNGRAILGATEGTLYFAAVATFDAGTYDAIYTDPAMAGRGTQALSLGVGPTDRLLNLSTRANVGPGGEQGLVSGFVVGAAGQSKKLIIRAVGPSLAVFGVTNPLRQPVLRIFDGNGQPYTNGYAYLPVVGGLTYETDLAQSLAKTGAFPIPAGTRDVVTMMPFPAGAYTAQVTTGDGTTGNVLLEIYEVP